MGNNEVSMEKFTLRSCYPTSLFIFRKTYSLWYFSMAAFTLYLLCRTTQLVIENLTPYPAGKYEIKIYYSGTRTECGICLNLTVNTPE